MVKRIICPKCDYVGVAKMKKRGTAKRELIGWVLLFPLGIPYSIWRMFGKLPVCKSCGHDILIDEASPVGQRVLERIYGTAQAASLPMQVGIPSFTTAARPEKSGLRPEQDPNQF